MTFETRIMQRLSWLQLTHSKFRIETLIESRFDDMAEQLIMWLIEEPNVLSKEEETLP